MGILVGLQFPAVSCIVWLLQPHGVGRLLAVSLLRPLLPFSLALSPLTMGTSVTAVYAAFLVPIASESRHDVLLSNVSAVFQIVGALLVQTPLFLCRFMSSCVPDTLMRIARTSCFRFCVSARFFSLSEQPPTVFHSVRGIR